MLVPIHDLTTLSLPNTSRSRAGTSRNMVIALTRPPASHRVSLPDKSGVLQAWGICIVHPSTGNAAVHFLPKPYASLGPGHLARHPFKP